MTTTTVMPTTATMGATGTSGTTDPVLTSTDGTATSTDGTTTSTDGTGGPTSDTSSTGSTGPVSPVVVTVPIAANADDGAIYASPKGGIVWAQSGEQGAGNGFFGEYPDGEYYVAHFRFMLPEPLNTRVLTGAHLRLEATSQLTYFWGEDHAVSIWLESDANAPAVAGPGSFPTQLGGPAMEGVALLDAAVRWPEVGPLTWNPGTNISPDVTSLFDALHEEAGSLVVGDYIQFWLTVATPTGTGGEVTYVDYASRSATPPELELTFE